VSNLHSPTFIYIIIPVWRCAKSLDWKYFNVTKNQRWNTPKSWLCM